MTPAEISTAIQASLPDARVEIRDLTGTGDHYQAFVGSDAFEGKSLIQQHQLVYKAVGPKVGGEVHALSLKTCTLADFDAVLAKG